MRRIRPAALDAMFVSALFRLRAQRSSYAQRIFVLFRRGHSPVPAPDSSLALIPSLAMAKAPKTGAAFTPDASRCTRSDGFSLQIQSENKLFLNRKLGDTAAA